MLHDERRTADYLAALAVAVRPDDVVLDIGTGSGVLAVPRPEPAHGVSMPSRPATSAGRRARMFASTGSKTASRSSPAGRASSSPRARRPAGRRGHRQRAVRRGAPRDHARRPPPVARSWVPTHPRWAHAARPPGLVARGAGQAARLRRAAVQRWRALYGIDFTPLLDAAIPGLTHTVTEGEVVATWPQVGPPVVLATLDLATFEDASVRATTDLVVSRPAS